MQRHSMLSGAFVERSYLRALLQDARQLRVAVGDDGLGLAVAEPLRARLFAPALADRDGLLALAVLPLALLAQHLRKRKGRRKTLVGDAAIGAINISSQAHSSWRKIWKSVWMV